MDHRQIHKKHFGTKITKQSYLINTLPTLVVPCYKWVIEKDGGDVSVSAQHLGIVQLSYHCFPAFLIINRY